MVHVQVQATNALSKTDVHPMHRNSQQRECKPFMPIDLDPPFLSRNSASAILICFWYWLPAATPHARLVTNLSCLR